MGNVNEYVILLRGVNVGGKSRVPMAELRDALTNHGYKKVSTYINSGNVLLSSSESASEVKSNIELLIAENFTLVPGSGLAHVLTVDYLKSVIALKPAGFGDEPERFHSDAIFLMGITAAEAISAFSPKEGVDTVWQGDAVIYSQRLSAERTKSRLNRVMSSPLYKQMTIRTWSTTLKLVELAQTRS